ncbi:hypothetical protein CROQUDRAFT_655606, partial [Cronartium quercuum f. sp. fusiforme G11]
HDIDRSTSESGVEKLTDIFRSILGRGYRLRADVKAYDTMITRLEQDMKQDPNCNKIQEDLNHKLNIREQFKTELDSLCRELALNLHKIIINKSENILSDLKPDLGLSDGIRSLENRLPKNQIETEQARKEIKNVLADLIRSNQRQTEEIADLRRQISGDRTSTNQIKNHEHPPDLNQEIQSIKIRLSQLTNQLTELHENFISSLSEDIPNNLQNAIRAIQHSLNSTSQSTIEMHYEKHSNLIQNFINQFNHKLNSIEQILNHHHPINLIPLPQNQVQNTNLSSKDPRLRRLSHNQITNNTTTSEISPSISTPVEPTPTDRSSACAHQ